MVLVTGATGFLGHYIVDELLANGYKVRLLVRNASSRKLPWGDLVEVIEGDLLDPLAVLAAIEGVDYVVHSAAVVSFWKRQRQHMHKVNVGGTANVVDACLEVGGKKLVHISSIAAIGRNVNKELITEQSKWKPMSINSQYAVSKRKAELEVYRGIAEGLEATIVNPGVIMGKGKWDSGTPKLFGIVDKGLKYYNAGINGFVGAKDVASAVRLVMEEDNVIGKRFILVERNLSQKDLFGMIAEGLGKPKPSRQIPPRLALLAGYLSEVWANIRGKEPLITRETMRTSIHQFFYDGSKIQQLGLQYSPIDSIIAETAKAYLAQKQA